MAGASSHSNVATRKVRTASYLGAGVAPASWTTTAPGVAAPNGRAYVTEGSAPVRYALNLQGGYITRAA